MGQSRELLVELYISDPQASPMAAGVWRDVVAGRPGVRLNLLDCAGNESARQRRQTIVRQHGLDAKAPLLL